MKPKKTIWLYWWWVQIAMTNGSFGQLHIHMTYSKKRHSAANMQAFHKEFGSKVGKMHRMKVAMEEFK